jgi:hypothetical protein
MRIGHDSPRPQAESVGTVYENSRQAAWGTGGRAPARARNPLKQYDLCRRATKLCGGGTPGEAMPDSFGFFSLEYLANSPGRNEQITEEHDEKATDCNRLCDGGTRTDCY